VVSLTWRYLLACPTFIYVLIGRNFLDFATMCKLALGAIQPPIQWVQGVQQPGPEANHTPTPSAKVKNEWSCTSIPHTSWHGA